MASEIKWIKLTTDMFEDEKIDFITTLPEANAILVIWVRLLTMAGKCNTGGFIFLTEKIPYTVEMLSHKFKQPLNVVKLAFETFRQLDMIDVDDRGVIYLPAWEKHQNVEAMEKVREYERQRKAMQRAKKKQDELPIPSASPGNVPDSLADVTVLDIDIDIDLDKEKNKKINYASKVSLSSVEYNKLVDKIGQVDCDFWIHKLNEYKIRKNKKYDSDYLTILNWIRKEAKETKFQQTNEIERFKNKKTSAQLAMDMEVARSRWIAEGKNPDEFHFDPTA